MEEKLEPFVRHGTEGKPIEVPADEVLDAIARKVEIDVEYAVIRGDLNIGKIQEQLEQNEDGKFIIEKKLSIRNTEIFGNTNFASASFSSHVNFTRAAFKGNAVFAEGIFHRIVTFFCAHFSGDVKFEFVNYRESALFVRTHFNGNAGFSRAIFRGGAFFIQTTFGGNADFIGVAFNSWVDFNFSTFTTRLRLRDVTIMYAAGFGDVKFNENILWANCWNYIIQPLWWGIKWLVTAGKGKLPKKRVVTDFSEVSTAVVMDGSSNPYLKRYIEDEQWISSWRQRSWGRRVLFVLWEFSSHCGRSIGLWAFWSVLIAVMFGLRYRAMGSEAISFNVDKLSGGQPDLWGYLYYSVVTFTTLGFGDIVPLTNWARFWVGLEVVLGYVMLGGLISIFANKLARRS